MVANEPHRQIGQRFGVRNEKVFAPRMDGIRSKQQGKFFDRDLTVTMLPVEGGGYLHRSKKGLIKNGAAGLQKAADMSRPLLMEITLNQSAGVEEENHSRSSRSSIIRRLKPVSLLVMRKTRFMSTGPLVGPIRESSPE